MKKIITFALILFTVSIFAQEWYSHSKDSLWAKYNPNPWNNKYIAEERAIKFNANDFDLEYPINLHAVTSYLSDDDYSFDYKIYDKDGMTILFEITRNSVSGYNDYYLPSPLVLTDDFFVSVVPSVSAYPKQVVSGIVSKAHSYIGTPGNWSVYLEDGDLYEHIIYAQISPYLGLDVYPPSIKSVTGTESFIDQDLNITIQLQDQNAIISPVVGEYSLDDGSTWTSFDLASAKGTFVFAGIIPGQVDGTDGLVRFNLEDDQGNSTLSEEYTLNWSSYNPIIYEDFEKNVYPPDGWTLNTVGAGWKIEHSSPIFPTPIQGEYFSVHMDDSGVQDDWLISPSIFIPNDGLTALFFYQAGEWIDYLTFHEVAVSSDGGSTWTQIYLDDQPGPSSDVTENFAKETIMLDAFKGQTVQIGWHYVGDWSDQWFIDDIRVDCDLKAPEVVNIVAESTILPTIGTYIDNDMRIELTLYDKFGVSSVVSNYSFDGGATYDELVFTPTSDANIWEGIIPAKSVVSSGTISFVLTDVISNEITTGNYDIEFLADDLIPEIVNILGLTSLVGNDANISFTIKDFSDISSCTGHYSKDDFVTQYDFDLFRSKINDYEYSGTIPAESVEIDNGKVFFVVEDINGNILSTDNYLIKWVDSYANYPQLDLRTHLGQNFTTPVKQQYYGTCWCFAAVSAIESNLKMTGNWITSGEVGEPDISEYHLSWWCGFNEYFNDDIEPPTGDGLELHMRGDYMVTSAYMSRGEGFVRDIDAPDYDVAPSRISDGYHYFYARDIEWYTMDDQLNGIDKIKQNIVDHGAVGTSLTAYYDFLYSDIINHYHYQPPSNPIFYTHAIAIIGWDDNIATQAPEGPGAWLCKDSYLEVPWSVNGYIWVSYYDKFVGRDPEGGAVSFQGVEPMQYDAVYYHDYHGWGDTMTEVDEAFNAFTLRDEDGGWLQAVSFFTTVDSIDYTVRVYRDFTAGILSDEVSTMSGYIANRGFHTIDLDNTPWLSPGDNFYIYLSLSDGGQPIDQNGYIPSAFLTYESSASPGESYYFDGAGWVDLYDNVTISSPGTANFCIKGLVYNEIGISEENVPVSTELEQNYPNPFNPETNISYSIAEDNSRIKLLVYNIKGELVNTLFEGIKNRGKHSIDFDASALNSGVYYYSLVVNGVKQATKKMVMIK